MSINNPYFQREELFETLENHKEYEPKEDLMIRKTYTYKSGAKYFGQWKGGFRHGTGAILWPDGAKYEGNWSEGHATGFGMLTHINGDTYTGQWYNDKAYGVGEFVRYANKELN